MGPALQFAEPASQIRCCIQNSKLDTTSWEHPLWPRPRMTRQQLVQFLKSSSCPQRNSDLDTPRFSSTPVFLVSWKKPGRTRLDLFFLGFSLELEARLLEWISRSSRTRNLLCMLVKEQLGIISRPKLGCGCNCGLQLNQTSSAHSLVSSRRNMKTKLPWLRPTLMVL